LISGLSFGQITAEKKYHNFGDLYPNMQTYVDIKFTNNTNKKHFLLNIDRPRDVNYIFTKKVLLPDSSMVLRLKVNASRKGKFNHEIDVYFSDSDQPVTIRLSGNIKEVAANPLTDCPDFNKTPPTNGGYDFAITVKVIDSLTQEPIRRAKVNFVRSNRLVGTYYTNKDGIIHREMTMGYYLVNAEKETYYPNYKMGYLNFQHNYILIKMQQPEQEEEEEPVFVINEPETPEETVEEEAPEIIIDLNEEPEEEDIIVETPPADTIPEVVEEIEEPIVLDDTPLEELPDTLFDVQHFKMNNITFILDVSSSMNSHGKLDLLKLSMTELVEILRPNDLISIIKYSSSVSVVADGMNGTEKENIKARVAKLRTSASTAGGDAIKVAYAMNRRVYSPKRNNIVIMITDGAFNKGSKDYLEIIAKNYQEKGIIFSVVGIKTSSYITEHMRNIVNEGGGDFIEVRNVEDAKTKIIKEIKRTSFRGR